MNKGSIICYFWKVVSLGWGGGDGCIIFYVDREIDGCVDDGKDESLVGICSWYGFLRV